VRGVIFGLSEPAPRAVTFYRIVKSDPPGPDDFLSADAKGIPPPEDDPEKIRLWDGISAYATEPQARRKAGVSWRLGSYIAVLDFPLNAPIRFERTTRSSGHYTLWGDPTDIAAYVVAIIRVDRLR